MKVRVLTIEERLEIKELIDKGIPYPQIGILVNRSVNTVRNEVRKHGGKEKYDPRKAQRLCDTADQRKIKSLLAYNAKNKPKITSTTIRKRQERLSTRISILEQKVELLTQIIKGKYGSN